MKSRCQSSIQTAWIGSLDYLRADILVLFRFNKVKKLEKMNDSDHLELCRNDNKTLHIEHPVQYG